MRQQTADNQSRTSVNNLWESLHLIAGKFLITLGIAAIIGVEVGGYLEYGTLDEFDIRLFLEILIVIFIVYQGYRLILHGREVRLTRLKKTATKVYEFTTLDSSSEEKQDNTDYIKYYSIEDIKSDLSKGKLNPEGIYRVYNPRVEEPDESDWSHISDSFLDSLQLNKKKIRKIYKLRENVLLSFGIIVIVSAVLIALTVITGILLAASRTMRPVDIGMIAGAIVGGIYGTYIMNKLHPILGILTALGVLKWWVTFFPK